MIPTESVVVFLFMLAVSEYASPNSVFTRPDSANFKRSLLIFLLCSSFATTTAAAQTIVSGNVSGTWTIEGSPFLLIDDATVETGTELIIEPGVEVVIGEAKSLNVYGKISAVGSSGQHIIFRSVADSVKFDRIYVQNGSSIPPISEFKYCEFRNAQTGLYLHSFGRVSNAYTTLQTNVSNCHFDSSVPSAIYVVAEAVDYSQFMTPRRGHARVAPIIDRCTFEGNQVGIEMDIRGAGSSWFSNGDTKAIIHNNIFSNWHGTAISILDRPLNSGSPSFVNNTFVDGERGIWIQDGDVDAIVINNIFFDTAIALERTGNNSSTAFYNCFYGNGTNFVGYPATYGDVVITNRNDDPSDLGFNIFQDPSFADSLFHLSNVSPCNNAGIDSIQVDTLWYHAPEHDFGGNARPMPAGTMPDMGALEMDYDYPVSIGSDPIVSTPASYELRQNYPNPFNPSTTIEFALPKAGFVTLTVYNVVGQKVATLVRQHLTAGSHKYRWDARGLASGAYIYRLESIDFFQSRKLLLHR